MRIIKQKTNFDFLGPLRRKLAISISSLVIISSFVALIGHDRPLEFGIDFTGGILLEVGYPTTVDVEGVRSGLEKAGFNDAQVQLFGADNEVLVRLPPQDEVASDELRERLRTALTNVDAGRNGVLQLAAQFVRVLVALRR